MTVPGPKPRYQGIDEPWVNIPMTELMANPKIRSSTKIVWLYLGLSGRGHMTVNVYDVHRKLGMSRSTVWRALLQLQDEGYISWDRLGKGGSGWDRHGNVTITSGRKG